MEYRENYEPGLARYREAHPANLPGGVVVDPTPVTAGEEITVFYNGMLAQAGTDQIYLRVGYGPARDWHRVQDLKMSRTGWGWIKTFEVPYDEERMNFCFRCGAYKWDNNGGMNWSYTIQTGRIV